MLLEIHITVTCWNVYEIFYQKLDCTLEGRVA